MPTAPADPSAIPIAELKPLVIAALLKAPGSSTLDLATTVNGQRKRVEDILRRLREKGLVTSVMGHSTTPKGRYLAVLWSPAPGLEAAVKTKDPRIANLKERVLALMADGQQRTSTEIAEVFGIPRETVRTCCRRLKDDRLLTSTVIKQTTHWRHVPNAATTVPLKPKKQATRRDDDLKPLPNVPWIHPIRARALGLIR